MKRSRKRRDSNNGYVPSDLQSAYNLPSSTKAGANGRNRRAFDDPNAESDLFIYRNDFGLPVCSDAQRLLQETQPEG